MNCQMFRELIFDYVGGALDADSLGDFRKHYDACAPCETTLRMVEAQETMLTALPRPKAPPSLWGRIQHEIGDRETLRRFEDAPRFRFGGWIAAAAALLIAFGTVFAIAGRPARPVPELQVRVVDISAQGVAAGLARMVPGYENPRPAAPLADALMGTNR